MSFHITPSGRVERCRALRSCPYTAVDGDILISTARNLPLMSMLTPPPPPSLTFEDLSRDEFLDEVEKLVPGDSQQFAHAMDALYDAWRGYLINQKPYVQTVRLKDPLLTTELSQLDYADGRKDLNLVYAHVTGDGATTLKVSLDTEIIPDLHTLAESLLFVWGLKAYDMQDPRLPDLHDAVKDFFASPVLPKDLPKPDYVFLAKDGDLAPIVNLPDELWRM